MINVSNYAYLIAPTCGWLVAQAIKFALTLRKDGVRLQDFWASGGMPSSHTGFMAALTTVIGLQEGFYSSIFGLALAITGVIVYDAMGVRRTVGEHTDAIRELQKSDHLRSRVILNDAKGHTPAEVCIGGLVGIIVGIVVYMILF